MKAFINLRDRLNYHPFCLIFWFDYHIFLDRLIKSIFELLSYMCYWFVWII